MPQYRKKPVVIEAFQMTKERRQDNSDWPQWLCRAWNKNHLDKGAVYPMNYPNSDGMDMLIIHTLEGNHIVNWNDFIIQGIQGELYSCKEDIFNETYELVK